MTISLDIHNSSAAACPSPYEHDFTLAPSTRPRQLDPPPHALQPAHSSIHSIRNTQSTLTGRRSRVRESDSTRSSAARASPRPDLITSASNPPRLLFVRSFHGSDTRPSNSSSSCPPLPPNGFPTLHPPRYARRLHPVHTELVLAHRSRCRGASEPI
ncbi:hypothetical protein B0H12DRAFT_384284 [Mycena haematopus]|nr:hypothetical protein B0H12DRAFT_384284 [Mycena haematopus]